LDRSDPIGQGCPDHDGNFGRPGLDLPGPRWLGLHSDRDRVRRSGVWNNNHVDEPQVDGFLDTMERLIERA